MNKNISAYQLDDLYSTLERVSLWIGNCDTKASITIGTVGIFFSILLSVDYTSKFKLIIEHMINNIGFWPVVYLLITLFTIVLIVMGSFFLFRVLVPSIETSLYKESEIKQESLGFFSTIAKINKYSDFKRKIANESVDGLRNDLITQIYICSKICNKKYESYQKGLFLTLFGCALLFGLLITGVFLT